MNPVLLKIHHESTYLKNLPMNWALRMKGQAYPVTLDELIRVIIDYERKNPGQWLSVDTVEEILAIDRREPGATIRDVLNQLPIQTLDRLRELPSYDICKDTVSVKEAVGVLCSHGEKEVRPFNWD